MNLPFGYSLRADFHGGFGLFLGILLGSILFIYFMNRRRVLKRGHLNKASYSMILLLRMVAVFIMLILIFSPELSVERIRLLPKKVAVVIDQSQSMLRAWEGGASQLQSSISRLIKDLQSTERVDVWSMNGNVYEQEKSDFLLDHSSFTWSPGLVSRHQDTEVYKALILVSDGQLNRGRSPLDQNWSKTIPIYPYMPLKPISSSLLSIMDLSYTKAETADPATQIHVKLRQNGLIGQTARLNMLDDSGNLLGQREYRLRQSFPEITIPIQLTLGESHEIRVVLSLIDGRFRSDDRINIDYSNDKKQVLLLSESINELHKFLRFNLPDSLFNVRSISGTSINGELSREAGEILQDFDLIILNAPGHLLLTEETRNIFQKEIERSTPIILFYPGQNELAAEWQEILDVNQIGTNSIGQHGVYWGEGNRDHPLVLELEGQGFSAEKLIEFPPISFHEFSLDHPGSKLLVAGPRSEQNNALTISDSPPRAIFNGQNYWEWFFYPQSKNSFSIFWEYLYGYLQDISSFKPLTLELSKNQGATGDFITADIAIADFRKLMIVPSELRVWQEDSAGHKTVLQFVRNKSGTFTATIDTKYAGSQRIIAEAFRYGELWGRDTSRINLIAYNEEFQSEGVDQVFLERLAEHSNGKVITAEKDLPRFAVEEYEERTTHRFAGIRSPRLFFILLSCILMEWYIRRRSGLL
ncbi:MAG: hypothetical protein K9N35_07285 [Candidatus Marinimicrobia bacterium]|nr:hypothetical protein [Candidatus Neomarinimicrobiota bacterium]